MTLVIVAILLMGFLLVATENITKVNRAAVVIFAGTVGWVVSAWTSLPISTLMTFLVS